MYICIDIVDTLCGVGVGLSLTVDQGDVDESLGVQQSLVSSSLRLLRLLGLLDLGGLRLNLTGTSQRSVNFSLKVSTRYKGKQIENATQ